MNFLDIAAGIGGGIPTAVQNVGAIANIEDAKQRLDLAKQSAINTQANEAERLNLAKESGTREASRLGIEEKRFGIQEQEDIRQKQMFELDMQAKQRANEEAIRMSSPTKNVKEFLDSFPVNGERSKSFINKLADVYLSDRAKKTGMASPAELKNIFAEIKNRQPEIAQLEHTDLSISEERLASDINKFTSLEESLKAKEKVRSELEKKFGNTLPKQKLEELVNAQVIAERKPKLDELQKQYEDIVSKKKGLEVRFAEIREAKKLDVEERTAAAKIAAANKAKSASKYDMYMGAAGGDFNKALALMKKDESDLLVEKYEKAAQTKMSPEVAKLMEGNLTSDLISNGQSRYSLIKAQINAADGDKKALDKVRKNIGDKAFSVAQDIMKMENMGNTAFGNIYKSKEFALTFFSPQEKTEYANMYRKILDAASGKQVQSSEAIPTPAQAPTKTPINQTPISQQERVKLETNWKNYIQGSKEPMTKEKALSILKTINTPQEQEIFIEALKKYSVSKQK
jgi:hypothetical protein